MLTGVGAKGSFKTLEQVISVCVLNQMARCLHFSGMLHLIGWLLITHVLTAY